MEVKLKPELETWLSLLHRGPRGHSAEFGLEPDFRSNMLAR